MKNNSIILTILAAIAVAAPAMAQAQKVKVDTAASSGMSAGKATPGTKNNAAVIFSVTAPSGNAVTGLTAADITTINFFTPVAAACGMISTGVTEIRPGVYQATMSMPALAQCVWSAGDYLAVVRVSNLSWFGVTPFTVEVR